MYHGGVIRNHGIERCIEALQRLDGVALVVLGNGQAEYVEELRCLAAQAGVDQRVLFHRAVPHAELWKYVGAADVDLAPIEVVTKNQYFSLPNKFFESIQSLTPVIASDVPEMKRAVEDYGIGLTCKQSNGSALAERIKTMKEDTKLYHNCKENLMQAKNDLCWEKEKTKLRNALLSVLDGKAI